MQLSEFDFELPQDLVALRPVQPRRAARLLVSHSDSDTSDSVVSDLAKWLRAGDLLVMNNTKVLPARFFGWRLRAHSDGAVDRAKVEITLMRPSPDCSEGARWQIMAKPLRKLGAGDRIILSDRLSAHVLTVQDGRAEIEFLGPKEGLTSAMEAAGQMPLPPYIARRRPADAQDREDYQTVFAQIPGAVAAPTASLHFDQEILQVLQKVGVERTYVTLHVGAGTFLPVQVDDIRKHKMHAEWGQVDDAAAQKIAQTKARGGRVIPVGTTALRLIESAARDGEIRPFEGETDIFIYPGFEFRVTDALMTNFHLPKSTLLMLVAALIGKPRLDAIYAHAISQRYRFFSYGDASLLFR